MILNEKYAVSHINYSTGRICVESDGEDDSMEDSLFALLRGFARLVGGEVVDMGMRQYAVEKSPYDFVFQIDSMDGIVITVEDMTHIDEIVRYVRESLCEINVNMLYEIY